MIVDPHVMPLRSPPKNERDLVIGGSNNWVLAFDNLSDIKDWLSDALCRIASGAGYATRALWTDNEESFFYASRPIIFNGIDDVINRNDLADRAIFITLQKIPEEERLSETELKSRFREAHRRILGGFLNALCEALKNIENTTLDKGPRMLDFALWANAATSALPWNEDKFNAVYAKNRREIIEQALDNDVVAVALQDWLAKDAWKGSASELYSELEALQDGKTVKSELWPKDVKVFGRKLRRLDNFLSLAGIELTFHNTRPRTIEIRRAKPEPKETPSDSYEEIII
jgi:hypothetical protein